MITSGTATNTHQWRRKKPRLRRAARVPVVPRRPLPLWPGRVAGRVVPVVCRVPLVRLGGAALLRERVAPVALREVPVAADAPAAAATPRWAPAARPVVAPVLVVRPDVAPAFVAWADGTDAAAARAALRVGLAAAHDSPEFAAGSAPAERRGLLHLPAACLPREDRCEGVSWAKAQPILPTALRQNPCDVATESWRCRDGISAGSGYGFEPMTGC